MSNDRKWLTWNEYLKKKKKERKKRKHINDGVGTKFEQCLIMIHDF